MTLLGWIVGGFGLAIGAWFFVIFLDWLGDFGQNITEEQARKQLRRSEERERREEEQREEAEKRRALWRQPEWRRRRIAILAGAVTISMLLAWGLALVLAG